jgi:hypothetical protein
MSKDFFFILFAESLERYVASFYASILFEGNHYDFTSFYLFALSKIFAVNFFWADNWSCGFVEKSFRL